MTAVLKLFGPWFLYGFLIIAGVGVMLLGKSDAVVVRDLRGSVENATVPFLEAVSRPADLMANRVEDFRYWLAVGEENARLREERLRLLQWEAIARRLQAENQQLRQLLNFVPPAKAEYVGGRIVSDSAGMFARSVLINAGGEHGVSKHDVVIGDRGVLGRVVSVAPNASRVLLVTDLNSRIPVFVGPLNIRAILAGDNTNHPRLIHLPPNAAISPGDRIATSGHGGVFPPGLPLGRVSETTRTQPKADLYTMANDTEFVRVADFDLGTIASGVFDTGGGLSDALYDGVGPMPAGVSWPTP